MKVASLESRDTWHVTGGSLALEMCGIPFLGLIIILLTILGGINYSYLSLLTCADLDLTFLTVERKSLEVHCTRQSHRHSMKTNRCSG